MMNVTTENIKKVAILMAKGETVDEIAVAFNEPKLAIENIMNFIKEISAISKPEPVASEKLDFVDHIPVLRKFVNDNYAGACITSEYGNNKHHETEIDFTYNGEEYTISLYQERVLFVKEVKE